MPDLGRFQRTAVDAAGNVLPLASVEVRSEASGLLATLFSDRAGAAGIANPFTADANGFAAFHAEGGSYKIVATLGATSITWRYVPVGTAAERDIEDIYDNAALTGTPTAPTAALGTDTEQIANMAALADALDFLIGGADSPFNTLSELSAAIALRAPIANPTFTGVPAAPTAAPGTNTTQVATTAFVQNVVGGAISLIQSQSVSGVSEVDFTGLDNTYDAYVVLLDTVKLSADDSILYLRIGTGAGPTYQTTNYTYVASALGGASTLNGSAQGQIALNRSGGSIGVGNATGENISGHIEFSNPETADFMPISYDMRYMRADTGPDGLKGVGVWMTLTAITALRFLPNTGTMSGRISLYGIKKA